VGKNINSGTANIKTISAWFYDDNTENTTSGIMALTLPEPVNGSNQLLIGVYNPAVKGRYMVRLGPSVLDSYTVSTAPRTVGWHKFTADFSTGPVRVFIDDETAPYYENQEITSFTRVSLGSLWPNTEFSTSAWDDLEITKLD
jgi:hypothetical protein